MDPPFSLPGFRIDHLLGAGGSGQVWRAREEATGDIVALKRVFTPPTSTDSADEESTAAVRRLRREAALLAGLRHPHLLRLRRVVPASDGVVLVLDFAAGGSLAAVLAARERLPPGEVVTAAAPIAEALAHLHAGGLVHGDVTPANILFDAAGKPLLADFGVARLSAEPSVDAWTPGYKDPAGAAGSASDVHGLAAACYAALTGVPPYRDAVPPRPLTEVAAAAPAPLAQAIDAALDRDPRARPSAAAFARALHGACTPEPIVLPGVPVAAAAELGPPTHVRPAAVPAPAPAPAQVAKEPGPAHRARLRWAAGMLAAAAVAALAAVAGVGWANHDRHGTAPPLTPAGTRTDAAAPASTSTAPPAQADAGTDWAQVMRALDTARDQAFEDADAATLDGVYLPGSPAGAADRQLLGRLVAAGEHARGLHLQLTSVSLESRTPNRAVLRVSDTLPGYDVVAGDGASLHEAGRGERDWLVALRAASGSWRIEDVTPVAPGVQSTPPAPSTPGLP